MLNFLRRLFGWAAMLAVPQYPTADPTPPGFNPRATVYPPPRDGWESEGHDVATLRAWGAGEAGVWAAPKADTGGDNSEGRE